MTADLHGYMRGDAGADIGIRMAVGADARLVRWLVLSDVARMLALGSAIGAATSVAAGHVIRSLLYEMAPWDPTVYASALGILVSVALAAASVPTRRATHVDPMSALRHD